MKKFLFLLIFCSVLTAVYSEVPAGLDSAADSYRLAFTTLMENDPAMVKELLGSDESWNPFQQAVLEINLILLTDKLSTLNSAVDNLDKISAGEKESMLYKIYRGMSEAFLARKKTVFGLPHLENTETYMTSIPEDYDDWFIRLLRGMSYYNLGRGLPGIGPMKEPKAKALSLGESDLRYVLEKHRLDSVDDFSFGAYDWSAFPVPDDAAAFAEEALR